MADVAADRPDPERLRLLQSVFEPSTLDEVAVAVAVATEHEHQIYVERVGDGYRWSLTHPGGGYPLLRITARFLRVEYARVMVPFRTVTAGVCVVCRDPQEASSAKRWAVIQFDVATPAGFVRERITETFGQPEERREGRDGIQERTH
jgi:hypothetical protein